MINEVFTSIQGEGKTQGQIRTFIRFNGCNLRCSFCDTQYTWGKGDIEDINWIDKIKTPYLCITGGEPCLEENWKIFIEEVLYLPKAKIKWIEVETNGTIIPTSCIEMIDLWNISPKDPNKSAINNDKNIYKPSLLLRKDLLNDYIVKFVIANKEDLLFVDNCKKQYKIPDDKIWLMPETIKGDIEKTKIIQQEIFDLCIESNYNYSARIHVVMKNNQRRY